MAEGGLLGNGPEKGMVTGGRKENRDNSSYQDNSYMSNINRDESYISNTNRDNSYKSNTNLDNSYKSNSNQDSYISNSNQDSFMSNSSQHIGYMSNSNKGNQYMANSGKIGTEKSKKNYWPKIKPEMGPPNYQEHEYEYLVKEMLNCKICDKKMWNSLSFTKHVRGKAHEELLEKLVAVDTERVAKVRKLVAKLESGGKNGQKCNMCDTKVGDIAEHRGANYHQELKKFIHPSCSLCEADFEDRKDLFYHLYCGEHLANVQSDGGKTKVGMEALNMDKLIKQLEARGKGQKRRGNDNTEKNKMFKKLKGSHVEDDEVVIVEDDVENGSTSNKPALTIGKGKVGQVVDSSLPGAEYVKSVEGYFCSLCKKFFTQGGNAVAEHCNSITHKCKFNATKEAAAAEKLKEESEDIQKRTTAAQFFEQNE